MIASQVARARVAEPIHPVGTHGALAAADPPGLTLASSADVYPDIVHGQAIFGVAERVAGHLLESGSLAGVLESTQQQRSAA